MRCACRWYAQHDACAGNVCEAGGVGLPLGEGCGRPPIPGPLSPVGRGEGARMVPSSLRRAGPRPDRGRDLVMFVGPIRARGEVAGFPPPFEPGAGSSRE